MSHTPGPWAVRKDMSGRPISVVGPDDRLVASAAYLTRDENEANARLIAAAPRLLDALVSLLKHHECRDCTSAFHAENVEDARGAIASATGKVAGATSRVAAEQNQPLGSAPEAQGKSKAPEGKSRGASGKFSEKWRDRVSLPRDQWLELLADVEAWLAEDLSALVDTSNDLRQKLDGRDMLSPCACRDMRRLVNFRTGEVVCGGCGRVTQVVGETVLSEGCS